MSTTEEYVISIYDMEKFVSLSRKLAPHELFELMNQIQNLTIQSIGHLSPLMVKNLGDANLMVFHPERVDETLPVLHKLKDSIEGFIEKQGFPGKLSFSNHVGPLALGEFGCEPFSTVNAYGTALNQTFMMLGKPYRGRFTISPELFRKLNPEIRKMFHKFTPPIMYTAD